MKTPPSLSRRTLGTTLLASSASACAASLCSAAHAREQGAAGGEPSTRSHLLGMGADLLQAKEPLEAMNLYLDGFHFYADDLGRPVRAHHFCTQLTEELHQCVIFDGNRAQARLIGIEYIISERLFQQLPGDEKRLWHSHHYETTSGLLVMPGIPAAVETEAMRTLAGTYGKTWHTWQIDRGDALPLGIPQLMMGYTRDGQLDPKITDARDAELGITLAEKSAARADIPVPTPAPGANAWQSGRTVQLTIEEVTVRNRRS